MKTDNYKIVDGRGFRLSTIKTDDNGGLEKELVQQELMPANMEMLQALQERLYAEDRYAVLVVLQAMDAAGKDGLIKHVMTSLNPASCRVAAFKSPSKEELDHDYLWRINKELPRRGEITIFNRSHYEEVAVARVHDLVEKQQIPDDLITDDIWERRYRQIRDYERYLSENGIVIIKFFLHISNEEQRLRLLERIENPDKHWKFNSSDIAEREHWYHYMHVYEQMIVNTSTEEAPWYCLPADRKWFTRYLASQILCEHLQRINPQYPELSESEKANLERCRELLQ